MTSSIERPLDVDPTLCQIKPDDAYRRGGDACPVYPAKRYVDWHLAAPAELS